MSTILAVIRGPVSCASAGTVTPATSEVPETSHAVPGLPKAPDPSMAAMASDHPHTTRSPGGRPVARAISAVMVPTTSRGVPASGTASGGRFPRSRIPLIGRMVPWWTRPLADQASVRMDPVRMKWT